MKRFALLVLSVLMGSGCGGGGEPAHPEEPKVSAQFLSAVFSGTVLDAAGRPVPSARVTVNGITRLTGTTGQYFISVTDSQTGYRIDVRKNGYGPVNEFRISPQLNLVHVLGRAFTKQISSTVANVIEDPATGIRVDLPANGLRTSSGAPVGTVTFSIAPHGPDTMPGDFTALNASGRRVALDTVGAATLSAVDGQGNTLALAVGATMTVRLPVPAAVGGAMPPCVFNGTCRAAMWRFNRVTGLWVEQPTVNAFNTNATTFRATGRQDGVIDPADGLGTWNADIEFTSPACTIIEFVNIPLDCYNPPPGTTPEPGLELSFTQITSSGTPKSKTSSVTSNASFVVLFNLRANFNLDLSVNFPPGAPAYCVGNLTMTSVPGPNLGFPVFSATGGATQYNSGPAALNPGYPTDSGNNPIDFADVVSGDHPCGSHVWISTSP